MRRINAQTGLIVLAILFVGFTAWSLRYFRKYQPFADLMHDTSPSFNQIGLQINDATVEGRSQGKKRWRVSARTITFSRDRRNIVADTIHNGVLFDTHGKPVVALSAGRASYATINGFSPTALDGSLSLENGIHAQVLTGAGAQIATEKLLWSAGWDTIHCPGTVTVTFANGTGRVSGQDVAYDLKTNDFTLHHLHGMFRVPSTVQ